MSRRLGRRLLLAVLVLGAATTSISTRATADRSGPETEDPDRPNIVLILTDDQRFDSLWAMRAVRNRLAAEGVTFRNAFVTNPLCCPSRASILTGRYSHHTGVYSNGLPHGGFRSFDDRSTIATWLDGAGYRTALIGKYMNDYRWAALHGYVPPGWDRWVAFTRNGNLYYRYDLSVDGALHRFGASDPDYSTDVLARYAVQFIRRTTEPLFLYFAPFAPHGPPTAARRDRGTLKGLPSHRPPNFNEADVDDKPRWLQEVPKLTPQAIAKIDVAYRHSLQASIAVDDAVGRILDALRDTGRIQNTMVVFASDNGFSFGEHRLRDKLSPYEESIRIPMVIRYDAAPTQGATDAYALNIDLAPTFADLAGVTPTIEPDGQSLVPLLEGSAWSRDDFLVEHVQGRASELHVPTYCSVRGHGFIYTVYENRGDPPTWDEELYDLERDPYERVNVVGLPRYAGEVADLRARLRALCDPPPPGFELPPWIP